MENSVGDLISRERLRKMIKATKQCTGDYVISAYWTGYVVALSTLEGLIADIPAVDAVPVVHGRWVPNIREDTRAYPPYTYQNGFKCSVCGRVTRSKKEPYCHCGAKMDKEGDDALD